MTSTYREAEPKSIWSGLNVSINICVDNQSLENDGFALGACVQDLQREGWYLNAFRRESDGVHALLSRNWEARGPRIETHEGAYAMTPTREEA